MIDKTKEPRFPLLNYRTLVKKEEIDRCVYVCINFNEVSHFFECKDPDIPEIYDLDGGMAFGTTVVMKNGDKIHIEREFLHFAKDMTYGITM